MVKLKINSVGNSLGIILPKQIIEKLQVDKGDQVFLVEHQDGYVLTAYDNDFGDQVGQAKKVMKRYKNTLRKLAK